jgi:HlyD family secretion protein
VVPAGEPLLEVADPDDLEIVSDLLSSDAVRVEAGDPVRIEQWGGDAVLEGTVRRVEPAGFTKISALGVEEQRVNAIIDFVDRPGKRPNIGDGYRVEVRIVVSSRENVLKVPASSLFRHENDWAVYVVVNDRAVMRIVQIGERNGLEAEVTGGLSGGERIIVYPSDAVTEGVEVRAR